MVFRIDLGGLFSAGKPAALGKIPAIDAAVARAEASLFPNAGARISVHTTGKREPVYEPTTSEMLLRYFEKMGDHRLYVGLKDGLVGADLGSGIGRVCLTLTQLKNEKGRPLFKKMTGFEFDCNLFKKSVELKKELGIKNVDLMEQDFMSADLSKYNFIYVFRPFNESPYRIVRKLKEATPGTIIVSRDYPYSPLVNGMMLHIMNSDDFDPGDFFLVGAKPIRIGDSNYFTYVRR